MAEPAKQFQVNRLSAAYWRVTFSNPPINLVDPDTVVELQGLVSLIEGAPELRVVVFDSADPDFFMARFDVARAAGMPTTPGPSGLPPWTDATRRLSLAPVVSIGLIRGRVRGGGAEIALAFDMRFASREKAIFGQPEVGAGLLPGGGAVEHLPQMMGRARALEVMLGSDDFDALTAERYGWINRALPDAELDGFVDRLARRIASFDREPLAEVKRLVNRDSLPSLDRLQETQKAFFKALAWPGVARRGKRLRELGFGTRAPGELEMGRFLAEL